MGFIKKNAFVLACAAIGLASLGLMLWGISRMGRVSGEMDQAVQLHSQMAKFTSKPVNTQMIDKENERYEQLRGHHEGVLGHFEARSDRTPILDSVLPEPPSGPEGKRLRYEFQAKYREAMRGLLTRLRAGQPPSKEEVDDTVDYLKKKAMEAEQFGSADEGADVRGARSPRVGAGTGQEEDEDGERLPDMDGPASVKPYWEALAQRVQDDPAAIISISKARSMYCYANVRPGGSFELHPIFVSSDDSAPNMYEIWYAQLFYWLQSDIVDALAGVNNAAAADLQEPWVGTLPVKDILSVRVSTYISDASGGSTGAQRPDLPPEDAYGVWTAQTSQALFDVINLRLRLVVDVRDLLAILHALCDDRYHSILSVSYTAIPPDLSFRHKVYGPEPAVEATIDLQTYLYFKSYVPLMPPPVRDELGIPDAEFERLAAAKRGDAVPDDESAPGTPEEDSEGR